MKDHQIPLCFFDTETTGLSPEDGGLPLDYRVLDISLVVTEPWPEMKIIGELHQKLDPGPEWIAKASQEALAINGYTPEKWANAFPSTAEFWQYVQQHTAGTIRVGQNVPFDSIFIQREFKLFGMKPLWQRRFIELMSYTHRLAEERDIIDPRTNKIAGGLHQVYDGFGFPALPPHTAKPDVLRGIAIYRHIMERLDQTM